MNLPNLISILRILLVPVFMLLHASGYTVQALGVLLLCAVSDVLDGALARRLNAVTDLGKLLDPVADKLIQAAMMLCAAGRSPSIWLLFALHLLKELLTGAMGLYVIHATGRVYSARWYGKLCTAAIYAVMGAALFWQGLSIRLLEAGVLLCAMLMTLCMALYMLGYMRRLTEACGSDDARIKAPVPAETGRRDTASTDPPESTAIPDAAMRPQS